MQVEQLPPYRRGRIAAIRHQIVPVAIPQLDRVEPEGVQHIVAMLRGCPRPEQAFAHRCGGRRVLPRCSIEDRRHAIEAPDLLLGSQRRVVGDIVRIPGETVERMHMRPKVAPDQK